MAPGGSTPSIQGDYAFLSARTDRSRDGSVNVFRVPLNGSSGVRALGPGRGAAVFDGRLYYAARDGRRVGIYTSDMEMEKPVLAATASTDCSLEEFGPSEAGVVWMESCSDKSRLHIPGNDDGEYVVAAQAMGYLATSTNLVAFATARPSGAYSQFVFVPSTGELFNISSGDSTTGISTVAGRYLAWNEVPGGDRTCRRVHLVAYRP